MRFRDQGGDFVEAPTRCVRRSATQSEDGLTAERLVQLRERVRNGIYDSPAVARALALRLLASGSPLS